MAPDKLSKPLSQAYSSIPPDKSVTRPGSCGASQGGHSTAAIERLLNFGAANANASLGWLSFWLGPLFLFWSRSLFRNHVWSVRNRLCDVPVHRRRTCHPCSRTGIGSGTCVRNWQRSAFQIKRTNGAWSIQSAAAEQIVQHGARGQDRCNDTAFPVGLSRFSTKPPLPLAQDGLAIVTDMTFTCVRQFHPYIHGPAMVVSTAFDEKLLAKIASSWDRLPIAKDVDIASRTTPDKHFFHAVGRTSVLRTVRRCYRRFRSVSVAQLDLTLLGSRFPRLTGRRTKSSQNTAGTTRLSTIICITASRTYRREIGACAHGDSRRFALFVLIALITACV